jgi:HAD superfamily hydrolase (TIGR01509 family)
VATALDRPAAVLDGLDAVLFDLDGVLTPTAVVHMHAWARLFAPLLDERGAAPYTDADYFAHIDGKPRYDGVASLLASRGIELPWGEPTDTPQTATVCGLGNRKNAVFTQVLETEGVTPYPGSVRLVDALIADGRKVAVVSSSRNAVPVLAAAGLADRFEVVVDGLVAAARGLAGKPSPATYLDAADQLGVPRERAVVVEDAESGVASGRAGDFGLVVGVDRGAGRAVLLEQGADLVVDDLVELVAPALNPDDPESTTP